MTYPEQARGWWRRRADDCGECGCDACGDGLCDIGCDLFNLMTLMRLTALLGRADHRLGTVDRAVTFAIKGYRKVSPRLPTRCRYQPTCSAYGLEAVRRYGSRKGLRLTAARLARCRPGVRYGTPDPVP